MRLRAAATLALLAVAPAAAADSIADQATRAYDLFAGGMSQQQFLSATYGRKALDGIAGTWIRLDGPDGKGSSSYGADTEKFCAGNARLTLASPDPLTLTLATNLPGDNFAQTYTLIAGATFAEHTDAVPYLRAIGLGDDSKAENLQDQRALALSIANGLLQLYRPSDDILVLTRDRGYPIVLARCPATP
jgi:hypothetical protein